MGGDKGVRGAIGGLGEVEGGSEGQLGVWGSFGGGLRGNWGGSEVVQGATGGLGEL